MNSSPATGATPRSSARCDRDKLPARAEAVARREQHLEDVVRAALGPAAGDDGLVPLVVGLTDFAVYSSLASGGVSTEAAAAPILPTPLPPLSASKPVTRAPLSFLPT